MDNASFKEIVGSFLDSSDQFEMDRGDLVLQLGTELITGRVSTHNGTLFVTEDGRESHAEDWIVNRLAMLPLLADRILSAIPETPSFVTPKGDFLDEINRAPSDYAVNVPDAVVTVQDFLARRPGGTCSALYLTSDAGEGKTTLINHLARLQAVLYKERKSDWLLVPIGLGGKPFLRFDDVVVASLMNQLRFQRLYFDAFLHLVRMGALIPALDGFEEIFVETSEGDAISSLGTLIRQLRGEGALLIAARRAYFEFRSLSTQAKLLDGLPNLDVVFGRVALHRWSRHEFESFASLNGVADPSAMYSYIAQVLSPEHPLLTRPVLVRRLIELAGSSNDNSFVEELRPRANTYFAWLVTKLIEREATEKWINKHGDPPKPLLSVSEHHQLLSYIAEEMWISKTSVLNAEMMDSLAEIFCDSKQYSPVISRQVKERLKQHALIVTVGLGRKEFAFDHDDFREFFLGEQLALHLSSGSQADIRRMFRVDSLPPLTIESATHRVAVDCRDAGSMVDLVKQVGMSESSSSFVRENAGAVIAPLLSCDHTTDLQIEGLVFPLDSLRGRAISRVRFKNCYFRPTSLERSTLDGCSFKDCEFEHLGLVDDSIAVRDSSLCDSRVHSLTWSKGDQEADFYAPSEIELLLSRVGFRLEAGQLSLASQVEVEIDSDLKIAEKALHTFHRSTVVAEGTFRLRLSVNANRFTDHVLPRLLRAGILESVGNRGSAKYKLATSLATIVNALASCKGSFEGFLEFFAAENSARQH